MKYKIGDRVKVIKDLNRDDLIGKIGIIIGYGNSNIFYGVEFNEYINGYNCDGKGKDGYCRWFYKDEIELVEPTDLNKVLQKLSDKISELADSSEEVLELLKDITNQKN